MLDFRNIPIVNPGIGFYLGVEWPHTNVAGYTSLLETPYLQTPKPTCCASAAIFPHDLYS